MVYRIITLPILLFLLSQHSIHAHNMIRRTQEDDPERIVGGEPTTPGRYPYQAGLSGGDSSIFCGGSLISPEWVLSAAHCGKSSHVEIGHYDLSNIDSSKVEIREVAFAMLHPNYSDSTSSNDVMLLRLKEASSYDTVTLNDGTADTSAGADVTVMGWGTTYYGSTSGSDILLEVEVDVVSHTDCNTAYDGSIVEDTMICAARSGKDACQGDSGGPLIIKGADASADVQVGIVSFGTGCADASYPGVYARVDTFEDWIDTSKACKFADGQDVNSLGNCCNVVCTDGVLTCQTQCGGGGSSDDDFVGPGGILSVLFGFCLGLF